MQVTSNNIDQITLKDLDVIWDLTGGICQLHGTPTALMWVDTTLAGLMSGVQSMVGTERFLLALQSEGRNSIQGDWQVISKHSNFESGFRDIVDVAVVAGWGCWELVKLDYAEKRCVFRVMNSWEALYQKSLGVSWGSAMLAGKFAGYCTKLFQTNCWADQTAFIADGDLYDEFVVMPSTRSIEEEIEKLLISDKATRADMAVALKKLSCEIDERKQAQAEVHKLAFYDTLTGLANRRLLQERLKQELSAALRHQHYGALLFIDLDHFKVLNDSLGHAMGDKLLIQVAERLLSLSREEDIVARIGGDEFILLAPNLSDNEQGAAHNAVSIADKIINRIAEPFNLFGYEHHITTSVGICSFPTEDEQSSDTILKHADIALYKAKSTGRNVAKFYKPKMQSVVDHHLTIENELRTAIKLNQFELYYQPFIEYPSTVNGLEALLRWNHPERGVISAGEFIEVAEKSGLILSISDWVLETACSTLQQWSQAGLPESFDHLSINISSRTLGLPKFVEFIDQLISKYDFNPNLLMFEITESLLLENISSVIPKLEALQERGIRFSLDDFGTGYSSLTYLKKLPINQIKIDRTFVTDIIEDENDQVIVDTILSMARHMDLNVVVEGVENEEQTKLLREKGCQYFQGYYFSKPLPILEINKLLTS